MHYFACAPPLYLHRATLKGPLITVLPFLLEYMSFLRPLGGIEQSMECYLREDSPIRLRARLKIIAYIQTKRMYHSFNDTSSLFVIELAMLPITLHF